MTVQIGMIPIILRDEMAADYWGTLLKIAEIGCQGIESGQVEVDLSEASGELAAEWFNPETGKNVLGETVRGSMADVFRSLPMARHAVFDKAGNLKELSRLLQTRRDMSCEF